MIDPLVLDARLKEAAGAVREFSSTESSQAWVVFLDSLANVYKEDLVTAQMERVPALQAQIKQVQELIKVVRSKHQVTGKI